MDTRETLARQEADVALGEAIRALGRRVEALEQLSDGCSFQLYGYELWGSPGNNMWIVEHIGNDHVVLAKWTNNRLFGFVPKKLLNIESDDFWQVVREGFRRFHHE